MKKKRMGRPPKSNATRRRHAVRTMLHDGELREIRARARAGGLTVSEYLRRIAFPGEATLSGAA